MSVEASYVYEEADGKPNRRVDRCPGKKFPQSHWTGKRWESGLNGTPPVPFRLPQLLAAVEAGETVYVVEGEKDVLALVAAGVAATTNPGGAGKWAAQLRPVLRGCRHRRCRRQRQAWARTRPGRVRQRRAGRGERAPRGCGRGQSRGSSSSVATPRRRGPALTTAPIRTPGRPPATPSSCSATSTRRSTCRPRERLPRWPTVGTRPKYAPSCTRQA